MSKADHGRITSTNITSTNTTPNHWTAPVLGQPARGYANAQQTIPAWWHRSHGARSPSVSGSPLPSGVSRHASNESLGELAETRRLIAALIANHKAIAAAERAHDKARIDELEEQHDPLYSVVEFADKVRVRTLETSSIS